MKFRTWAARNRRKVADIAGEIGVHRTTVYNWLDGKSMPRPKELLAIEKMTKGLVTPRDFARAAVQSQRRPKV